MYAGKNIRILLSSGSSATNYESAIRGVGGEPTAIYAPEVDTSYDGLILCGGSDVHPKYYGEEIAGSVGIDEKRDAAEFALLKAYVEAGKPVLGICRGCQLINVFFGGSLYQHLPEYAMHQGVGGDAIHQVTASEGSILHGLYGDTFAVNSSHHQAVKDLGADLRATAYWNNQYVEAYEHLTLPVFAVQWHPERMCFGNARPDTVDGAGIFEQFIDLCGRSQKDKNVHAFCLKRSQSRATINLGKVVIQ